MTAFQVFIDRLGEYFNEYPHMRHGQVLFNALNDVAPALAETIRATPADPFYAEKGSDNRVLAFWKTVCLEIDK